MRVLVVTWGPGGNLPPLLAAANCLARRGHEVMALASAHTRAALEGIGLHTVRFRRSPDPDVEVAFEAQADLVMATAAGLELALDVQDAIEEARPDLAVVDCMLPAALAAGEAAGTPTASIVHFLYGQARRRMVEAGGGWTTDLDVLAGTRRALGLPAVDAGPRSWETPELVLVTAPSWFDVEADAPRHVLHAGPLGVEAHPGAGGDRVLLSFSTTVMEGQRELIERVCAAVTELGLPTTLTLGPALEHEALEVPEEIEVLPVADHDQLMPECSIVICHGGLGTVLRGLAHGVPQLVLPLGRDQAFNASRVEGLGAGLGLPLDAQPERIRAGIRTLLTEPSFRAASADAAARIAREQPDLTAAEALERVAHR